MKRLLHTSLNIVWGLWFGGLVMLFLAVSSLFQTFALDHTIAGQAAAGIFRQFNALRLGLAAAALLLTAGSWLAKRSKVRLTIFVLFALATVAAFCSSAILTPRIDHLRLTELTHSAEFARLHGISMTVYLIETLLVFAAGVILPSMRE
jgi:hypothetical protein